jgi:Arc/MetJ family transcription regulator
MRTNVFIDDDLLSDYMAESGLKTKRKAIDTALRTSLALKRQERIRALRGKIEWVGDLDDMRTSKHIPADE